MTTMAQAARNADLAEARRQLNRQYPVWWPKLDRVRQDVLVELTVEIVGLGVTELDRIVHYVKVEDYALASASLLMTPWTERTGQRAWRLAAALKNGVADPIP